jgi:hypothetical protein
LQEAREQQRKTPVTAAEAAQDPFLKAMNERLNKFKVGTPEYDKERAAVLADLAKEEERRQGSFGEFEKRKEEIRQGLTRKGMQGKAGGLGGGPFGLWLSTKNIGGDWGDCLKGFSLGPDHEENMKKLDDATRKGERRVQVVQEYKQALQNKTQLPKTLESEQQRIAPVQQLLMSLQSLRVSPRYQSVEEAYKNVQIEALNKDPLELALENMVTKHLLTVIDLLGKQVGVSGQTTSFIRSMSGVGN